MTKKVHYIDEPPGDPDWIKKVSAARRDSEAADGTATEDSPEGDTPAQ